MKFTNWWKGFPSGLLLLSLTWILYLQPLDDAWGQDKTSSGTSTNTQTEGSLDLRGDVPSPRQLDAQELHKLPRTQIHTPDPQNPAKEIVYSGPPFIEILKAGGLRLDSNMAGLRALVSMTVVVEATDGYRAAFSLAELDPELTDRVVLLADTVDDQPLPSREAPFRLIVPGDKHPTRWVRQVKMVTVRKN
jgi:hypothetical protein